MGNYMKVSDIQQLVDNFTKQYRIESAVQFRCIDLASEVGELSRELLISTNYGKNEFEPTDNWQSEIGDILFSLICLANSTNVDLEKALYSVLEKYTVRFDKQL